MYSRKVCSHRTESSAKQDRVASAQDSLTNKDSFSQDLENDHQLIRSFVGTATCLLHSTPLRLTLRAGSQAFLL